MEIKVVTFNRHLLQNPVKTFPALIRDSTSDISANTHTQIFPYSFLQKILYQTLRRQHIQITQYRKAADDYAKKVCLIIYFPLTHIHKTQNLDTLMADTLIKVEIRGGAGDYTPPQTKFLFNFLKFRRFFFNFGDNCTPTFWISGPGN
jgi:hypothetical protein